MARILPTLLGNEGESVVKTLSIGSLVLMSQALFLMIGCGSMSEGSLLDSTQPFSDSNRTLNVETESSMSKSLFIDDRLKACVEDASVGSEEELRILDCSEYGIRNLSGIERFSNLESLILKGNPLENGIDLLDRLSALRFVDLRNTGHGAYDCSAFSQISQNLLNVQIMIPDACKSRTDDNLASEDTNDDLKCALDDESIQPSQEEGLPQGGQATFDPCNPEKPLL